MIQVGIRFVVPRDTGFLADLWSAEIIRHFKRHNVDNPHTLTDTISIDVRAPVPARVSLYESLSLLYGDPNAWKIIGDLPKVIVWLTAYDPSLDPMITIGEYLGWWARQVGTSSP